MHYFKSPKHLCLLLCCIITLAFPLIIQAQEQLYKPLFRDSILSQNWIIDYFNNPTNKSRALTSNKKSAIIYFRPEYRIQQNGNKPASGDFGLTSIRLDIRGPVILNKLDFRFRSRYFPTITAYDRLGYNRVNFSLDYVYINWHINPKVSLMVGKNLRLYPGYEWDMAPFIINHYNQYLLSVENFFPIGIQTNIKLTKNNNIIFGLYQPLNKTIENQQKAIGYNLQSQKASNFPIGWGASWRGNLLNMNNRKFQTFWGIFGEQNFQNEMNFTIVFGQRYTDSRVSVFFDYTLANMPTDFSNLSSNVLDKFLFKKGNFVTNIIYHVASTRLDLSLSKKKNWILVFTGQYERGSQKHSQYQGYSNQAVDKFRQIWMGNLQLEYFPIHGQDLRFYIFAEKRYDIYNESIRKNGIANANYNSAGAGVIYSLPLL